MSSDTNPAGLLANLQRFTRRKEGADSCELCGAEIGAKHRHLLRMTDRRVVCGCDACAILFESGARFRTVPCDVRLCEDFAMTDLEWNALAIPVRLAFVCHEGYCCNPTIRYPSPVGATEAGVDARSWTEIVARNPVLRLLRPHVESLLINRIGEPYEHYLVPIDECYRLTGIIRTEWRGFSGGAEVWQSIRAFLASLRERATRARRLEHA